MDSVKAYVTFDGRKLKYHLFSPDLPPLLAIGGKRAGLIMSVLREELGSYVENRVETVTVKPLNAPAVLVWIAVSVKANPSRELLHALTARTPKPAVDFLFELIDTRTGYGRSRPLIPPKKLYRASKILIQMLELLGYTIA